jgi:hypothetical protein
VLPKYENYISAQADIEALVQKHDKNGDSLLDDVELMALMKEVHSVPFPPSRQMSVQQDLKHFHLPGGA